MFEDLIPQNNISNGMFDDLVKDASQSGSDRNDTGVDSSLQAFLIATGKQFASLPTGLKQLYLEANQAAQRGELANLGTLPDNEIVAQRMSDLSSSIRGGEQNIEALREVQAERERGLDPLREQFPKSVIAGEIAGSAAPMFLAPQLSSATLPGKVAIGAGTGIMGSAIVPESEKGQRSGNIKVGALLGGALPVGFTTFKGLLSAGKRGISSLMTSVKTMSEDGAAKVLAEQMVREGLSVDDVSRILSQTGDDAILADAGDSFARLLRLASNKIPSIQGKAKSVLDKRQAGQDQRILEALDGFGFSSLSVDDEISRMNAAYKPQIDKLYEAARSKPMRVSEKLRRLLTSKNDLSKAMEKAQPRLANKRALGEAISNIDVIDATKQELDDQIGTHIRAGENNLARDKILLKNILVQEADNAVPEYKQARNLFAGKAALEDAANKGKLIFRMAPRDIEDVSKTMSDSERRMFIVGAKEAIVDKIDNVQLTHDSIRRIFGKRGDIKRIRSLFTSQKDFDDFKKIMEKEARFVLTRREAQANSTTAKQLFDEEQFGNAMSMVRAASGDPIEAANLLGRIRSGLSSKKGTEANTAALELIGDILLSGNAKQERIISLLKRGSNEQLESAAGRMLSELSDTAGTAIGVGAGIEAN